MIFCSIFKRGGYRFAQRNASEQESKARFWFNQNRKGFRVRRGLA
jgi:hypothetical protein